MVNLPVTNYGLSPAESMLGLTGAFVRIDVRKGMATCVRKIGGAVLDDSLKNPRFDPARSDGLRPPTRAGQPQR
jgi:hypothetical protein